MSLSFKLYITSANEALQQIRRLSLPATISWSSFLETLSEILQSHQFWVRYEDEEEDLVTINTQLEWAEALSILDKNSPIRLQITQTSSLSSSTFSFLNTTSSPPSEHLFTPFDTPSNDLMRTVVIPGDDEEPKQELQTEQKDGDHQLGQSFELLGLGEALKQTETLGSLETPLESSNTQPEVRAETSSVSLTESFQLPVGFSPSFLENVNFVPDIFSGKFWLSENRSTVKTNEPVESVQPAQESSSEIPIENVPSIEQVPESVETSVVVLPAEPSVEQSENKTADQTELLKSIVMTQKWVDKVDELMEMGFEFTAAVKAMQQANGSMGAALEILLN